MHLHGKNIAVIGAGIGGLAAALAMALRGAKVQVFEQAESLIKSASASATPRKTIRQWLIDHGKIYERKISIAQLYNCDEIFLVNSVRKWRRAQLYGKKIKDIASHNS